MHHMEQKKGYLGDCVYWYISEALVKWVVGDIGKRFNVNLLGYAHWFMSIIIYHIKHHYISVDQAIYVSSIVAEYLDAVTVKTGKKNYKNTLPSDIILTKTYSSTSDEKV